MADGYCVKCKTKREMKDAKEVTMNGKGGKKQTNQQSQQRGDAIGEK